MPRLHAIDHLVLSVADPEATARFYAVILGCEPLRFEVADGTTRLALQVGRQKINLHTSGRDHPPHAARPTPGSADLCLLTSDPLIDWQAHLARHGVAVEEGPVARTGAIGRVRSIYLRDSDGNPIEIAEPAR